MVKSNRNGQTATLSAEQLDALAQELAPAPRAVFSVCRCTAAHVNGALSLKWESITQPEVVIPKMVTKKKMKTRAIPMNPRLWQELADWREAWRAIQGREPEKCDFVFPNARDPAKHMTRQAVDKALRVACAELDVVGASTHALSEALGINRCFR